VPSIIIGVSVELVMILVVVGFISRPTSLLLVACIVRCYLRLSCFRVQISEENATSLNSVLTNESLHGHHVQTDVMT
jgi:hypothetical protein